MPPALTGGRVLLVALATAAPLSVVAVGASPAYTLLKLVALAVIGLILLAFAAGYGAMSRRAPSPGPLYTVVARGLVRPIGLGAALIALLSYGALQLSLYATAADALPFTARWWQVALACWLVVALLGLVRIQIVGWLLVVVVLAEIVVIAGISAATLLDPAVSHAVPLPTTIDRPALGLLLVTAALTFVGFETAAAYARSITRTTCLAVLLLAVLYAAASLVPGPFLASAATSIAPWGQTVGRAVLLTGLLAAMVALHHTSSRYLLALARDWRPAGSPPGNPAGSAPGSSAGGLSGSSLGVTSGSSAGRPAGSLRGAGSASLVQTLIMGLVLCVLVAFGPLSGVPGWVAPAGGIGILLLLTAASLAALIFLNRSPNGENTGQRILAPAVATIALGVVGYLAFANLGTLLGAGPQTRIVPGAFGAALLLGLTYGLILRTTNPIAYAGIALGSTAIVITPAAVPIPQPRTPGAHRPERIPREIGR